MVSFQKLSVRKHNVTINSASNIVRKGSSVSSRRPSIQLKTPISKMNIVVNNSKNPWMVDNIIAKTFSGILFFRKRQIGPTYNLDGAWVII